MFELFGLIPILKICSVIFVISFVSFLLGGFVTNRTTNNNAISLFIGLTTLLAIISIVNSGGLTIFSPSLVCILLLFKPKYSLSEFDWRKSLHCAVQFFGFFIPFLVVELIRQSYFSNEIVYSGFGDYQFYTDTAQNIWQSGIESSLAYLSHYNISTSANIYHYYDLYLLVPVFILKIPPLLGYFFYYLPFVYSLAAYSLFSLSTTKKNIFLVFLASFFALHVIGLDFNDFSNFKRLTAVQYPKACFIIFPLLLMDLRKQWSLNKVLITATFLSLMINPLIFLLIGLTSLVIFFIYKSSNEDKFISFFNWEYLIIYGVFILYFIYIFSSKSDNSVLFTFMDNVSFIDYLAGVRNRFVGYAGVIKKLPVLLLCGIILAYHFYKNKTIDFSLAFITMCFLIGHVVCSLMYNHYEGMQFFNLPFVALMAAYFFFTIEKAINTKLLLIKVSTIILFLAFIANHVVGGFTLFTKPTFTFATSVNYNKKIKNAVSNYNEINALFFVYYSENVHWIRTIPYLTYELGYMNLYQNVNCLIPTDPNMFLNSPSVKYNAINLISRGPFSLHCQELNLKPTSIYDKAYEIAVRSFIEKHNINVLVFESEVYIPDWVETLNPKVIVKPQDKIDVHEAYFL